ncbi:MAG: HD domain-containing protein [Patescibacteria group bacterium]
MIPYVTEEELLTALSNQHFAISPLFKKALLQAKKSHKEQKRDDGKPYLEEHIYPVTLDLAANFAGRENLESLLAGALLHDVIEDDAKMNDQRFIDQFGIEIYGIIKPITKSREDNSEKLTQIEKRAINEKIIRRLKQAPEESCLVKLSDRANNLECSLCLKELNPAKFERYIKETEDLYLPLASNTNDYYYNRLKKILKELDE